MRRIPEELDFDSTARLLADPYRFIGKRCRKYGTPLFRARIMLRPTVCLSGRRAAALFYRPDCFLRTRGAPEPIRGTLLGKGGVQGLDGVAHAHRKRMFLDLLTPERAEGLAEIFMGHWRACMLQWTRRPGVVLYDEMQRLLTRAVCEWAGVPLPPAMLLTRTQQLSAMFDSAATGGRGNLWARWQRGRAEYWIGHVLHHAREGKIELPSDSAAHAVCWHQDRGGQLLALQIAAVELLNVLRPVVANAVFIVFAAHALHRHPELRERMAAGDGQYTRAFVQEVRRYYPFFPAVAARVRQSFEWEGYQFKEGERALLDLYGTNHDPDVWVAPDAFDPARFLHRQPGLYDLVPQGGGRADAGHRCPGESVTLVLLERATTALVHELRYRVPEQNLAIDFSRLPALPMSRFAIEDVQLGGEGKRVTGTSSPDAGRDDEADRKGEPHPGATRPLSS